MKLGLPHYTKIFHKSSKHTTLHFALPAALRPFHRHLLTSWLCERLTPRRVAGTVVLHQGSHWGVCNKIGSSYQIVASNSGGQYWKVIQSVVNRVVKKKKNNYIGLSWIIYQLNGGYIPFRISGIHHDRGWSHSWLAIGVWQFANVWLHIHLPAMLADFRDHPAHCESCKKITMKKF